MTSQIPEIGVVVLGLGVLLAVVCYLTTGLSPGGMITPGWVALVSIESPKHVPLIAITVLLTYFIIKGVQKIVILYGKRLFGAVVMVAILIEVTGSLLLLERSLGLFSNTTLGFVVPGLVTYQLLRQPLGATVLAIATVSAFTYIAMLAAVLLRLIPQTQGAALVEEVAARGLTDSGLTFAAAIAAIGIIALLLSMRRVGRRVAAEANLPPGPLLSRGVEEPQPTTMSEAG